MEEPTAIPRWLANRADLLRLILSAILLSLGVNILSGVFLAAVSPKGTIQIAIGVALILLPLVYLVVAAMGDRATSHEFEATLLFDARSKAIVPVPQYEFSDKVARALRAVLAESKALAHHWENPPLFKFQDREEFMTRLRSAGDGDKPPDPSSGTAIARDPDAFPPPKKAQRLLQDVLEFVALDSLSDHLSEYFSPSDSNERFVKRLTRKDVPTLLLDNPVLALISGPPELREPFLDSEPDENVYAIFSGDHVYSKFELTLPKGAKLLRIEPGTLRIDSPRVDIEISVRYEGFSTFVPSEFLHFHCGLDDELNVHSLLVRWRIAVRLKLPGLFSRSG